MEGVAMDLHRADFAKEVLPITTNHDELDLSDRPFYFKISALMASLELGGL